MRFDFRISLLSAIPTLTQCPSFSCISRNSRVENSNRLAYGKENREKRLVMELLIIRRERHEEYTESPRKKGIEKTAGKCSIWESGLRTLPDQ